jgi:demethoxyubiquinone hydroxylase (CLK1/Coq7/Cat5 family)
MSDTTASQEFFVHYTLRLGAQEALLSIPVSGPSREAVEELVSQQFAQPAFRFNSPDTGSIVVNTINVLFAQVLTRAEEEQRQRNLAAQQAQPQGNQP